MRRHLLVFPRFRPRLAVAALWKPAPAPLLSTSLHKVPATVPKIFAVTLSVKLELLRDPESDLGEQVILESAHRHRVVRRDLRKTPVTATEKVEADIQRNESANANAHVLIALRKSMLVTSAAEVGAAADGHTLSTTHIDAALRARPAALRILAMTGAAAPVRAVTVVTGTIAARLRDECAP